MHLLEVGDDGIELLRLSLVDDIVAVVAGYRLVGGNDRNLRLVDLLELGGLGVGSAGHASQLVVLQEVLLVRNRREGFVFLFDLQLLFGLHRLVQQQFVY